MTATASLATDRTGLARLTGAIADTGAIASRHLRTYSRSPQLMVAATIQPIMTVLLFKYIFGGAISVPGYEYVDYLMPGVFGWTVAMGAADTAVGVAGDVKSGMIERFRSLPMTRTAFLAGRTVADLVRNAFVLTLVFVLGLAVGFRIHTNAVAALAGFGLVLLFGYACGWIAATIGMSSGDPEKAQAGFLPLVILLVFSSNAFVPPETMPDWLQPFVEHQPLSAVLTAVRALLLGGPTAQPVVEALAWTVGLLALFVPLAVSSYRKATR